MPSIKNGLFNFSNLVEANIVHHQYAVFSIGISKVLEELVEEIQEARSVAIASENLIVFDSEIVRNSPLDFPERQGAFLLQPTRNFHNLVAC
jgi:hypothetical protein